MFTKTGQQLRRRHTPIYTEKIDTLFLYVHIQINIRFWRASIKVANVKYRHHIRHKTCCMPENAWFSDRTNKSKVSQNLLLHIYYNNYGLKLNSVTITQPVVISNRM